MTKKENNNERTSDTPRVVTTNRVKIDGRPSIGSLNRRALHARQNAGERATYQQDLPVTDPLVHYIYPVHRRIIDKLCLNQIGKFSASRILSFFSPPPQSRPFQVKSNFSLPTFNQLNRRSRLSLRFRLTLGESYYVCEPQILCLYYRDSALRP